MKTFLRQCFPYWQWLLAYGQVARTTKTKRSDTGKPALPTITVSEPALSADNTKAVVTVTPSDDTENGTGSANRKANQLPHIRL